MTTDLATPALEAAVPPQTPYARVFAAQQATALALRNSGAVERLAKIERLKRALLARRERIHAAGAADFGKPAPEVDLTEILPVLAEANDARRHLRRWMKPRKTRSPLLLFGTAGEVQYQPKGRTLIVSPWNYPLNLTFGPLVSAIAAGNTAIVKPSELTPNLSALMVEIVRECFREDEVAIFEGDASVSQALLELPFDHIFFTGSPAIGMVVMAAAAKNLASVTLELGGKSPSIVDASADVAAAAANLMWSKFTNAGQTCIAPDHVYVHESVHDAFVRECRDALARAYGADPKASPHLARIVNPRHAKRLAQGLDDAKARGARVLAGGAHDVAERFVAPTLLDRVPADAALMRDEIFGPLLPIVPFADIDDVIDRINRAPKPLALYVWSRSRANVEKIVRETSSGGVCVNHSAVHFFNRALPFGGVNTSGIGSAHGFHGFKAFSHERAVLRSRLMLASVFYPPYTDLKRRLIEWALKLA